MIVAVGPLFATWAYNAGNALSSGWLGNSGTLSLS